MKIVETLLLDDCAIANDLVELKHMFLIDLSGNFYMVNNENL